MRSKLKRILFSLKVIVDGQWMKYFVILWMVLSFEYDIRITIYFSLLWEIVVKKPVLWVLISSPWANLSENLQTDSWMSFHFPLPHLSSKPALHVSWTAAVACWQSPAAVLPPSESLHSPWNLLRASPNPRTPTVLSVAYSLWLGSRLLLTCSRRPCFAVAGLQQA